MQNVKNETSSISRLQGILNRGDFYTEVSSEATIALKESQELRKKIKGSSSQKKLKLDFEEVNKTAIAKRGNLKVYQNLPKGIRVVAR